MTVQDSAVVARDIQLLTPQKFRFTQLIDRLLTALGIGLLSYVFFIYAISMFLFLLGHPVSSNTVWCGIFFSSTLVAVLAFKEGASTVLSVCAGLTVALLILVCAQVSGLAYDLSWDGMAYHQEAIIQLAEGWNPVRAPLSDSVPHVMWINHYPKFSWTFAANHYLAFGNIESGKSHGFILAASLALLVPAFLRRLCRVNWCWALVLSCLVVANPVLINQLFTYYVDGLLYLTFALTCVAAVYSFSEKTIRWYVLFGISGIMLVNTKFTGLPYFCLISAAAAAYLFITRQRPEALRFSIVAAVVLVIAFPLFGYDTYIRNLVDHGHVFYPLFGTGAVDIITGNTSLYFQNLGFLEKFLVSVFHVVSNVPESAQVRLPFLLQSRAEIYDSVGADVRFSGFGFWFSGIFVSALGALTYIGLSRAERFPRRAGFFAVVAVFVTVLVNPEAYWARYVPQLWLFPLITIVLLRFSASVFASIMSWFLVAIMTVNSGLIMRGVASHNYHSTLEVERNLSILRSSANSWAFHFGAFPALRARLDYHDVAYSVLPDATPLPCTEIQEFPYTQGEVRYCQEGARAR